MNRPETAPTKRLNSFLLFDAEDERSPEEISDELMGQMMGLMSL